MPSSIYTGNLLPQYFYYRQYRKTRNRLFAYYTDYQRDCVLPGFVCLSVCLSASNLT